MSRGVRAGNHGRGSHWIRDEKRIRIYERDSWKCVWCGCRVATDRQLRILDEFAAKIQARTPASDSLRLATLDHVLPRTRGGSNHHGNLVTSCSECNEARGEWSAIEWADALSLHCYDTTGWSRQDAVRDAWRRGFEARVLDRVIEAMGRELPPAAPKRKPPKKAA